jgi:AcrR family transcriptional regulator
MVRTGPGKREAQRQETKGRLQASALDLFRRDGFEATSVAQIAEAAGVTERTFFRYFPSKEAVLFQDYESRLEWFRAALAVRPVDESVLDSVVVAVGSFPDDREILHQIAALRQGVLSPDTIESHLRLVQGAFARELEAVIRTRREHKRDADESDESDESDERIELVAVVMANAIAGALLGTLDVWTRRGGGAPEDMEPLTIEAFEILQGLPLD